MKRYALSSTSLADLEGIWDYAEKGGTDLASHFLDRIYEIFAMLSGSPMAGAAVPQLTDEGVRKFPVGNYIVYYRSIRGGVRIVRVIHGKRRQRQALRNIGPRS